MRVLQREYVSADGARRCGVPAEADELPGPYFDLQVSPKSYRDLPQRYAELGNVYRYERSGTMHGLLRVRGFTQDDAHIFCTPAQVVSEIEAAWILLRRVEDVRVQGISRGAFDAGCGEVGRVCGQRR